MIQNGANVTATAIDAYHHNVSLAIKPLAIAMLREIQEILIRNGADVNDTNEESGDVKDCIDVPGNNCPLMVKIKYCTKYPEFAEICCKSCTESGQLDGYVPPPPQKITFPQN